MSMHKIEIRVPTKVGNVIVEKGDIVYIKSKVKEDVINNPGEYDQNPDFEDKVSTDITDASFMEDGDPYDDAYDDDFEDEFIDDDFLDDDIIYERKLKSRKKEADEKDDEKKDDEKEKDSDSEEEKKDDEDEKEKEDKDEKKESRSLALQAKYKERRLARAKEIIAEAELETKKIVKK